MAKNRKNQSVAIRFGPAIKALLLCLLIGGFGIGYVWQKEQINRLGQQQKERENHLKRLTMDNKERAKQLADMRNPEFLIAKIKEMKLELAPPQPSQIWRLPEPPVDGPPEAEPQYAARERGAPGVQ
jgi:hypothetical protein